MSRAVRLELPYPPAGLNPNRLRRLHWSQRSRVVREYREEIGWDSKVCAQKMMAIGGPTFPLKPPVEATVTFVVPDRRKTDEDNLLAMLKPAWDGLVDAGVLTGDSHDVFRVTRTEVRVEPGESRVIVELKSAA